MPPKFPSLPSLFLFPRHPEKDPRGSDPHPDHFLSQTPCPAVTHTPPPQWSQRPPRAGEHFKRPSPGLEQERELEALSGVKSAVPSAPPRRPPTPPQTPTIPTRPPSTPSSDLSVPPTTAESHLDPTAPLGLNPDSVPPPPPAPPPVAPGPPPRGGRGRGGPLPHPSLPSPGVPVSGRGGPGALTSLELRLPRTYLARARGGSGSSRSSSGGSRRRRAGARGGSIPAAPALAPAPLRLPLRPSDGGESARAGRRAPPIKGAAGRRTPRPLLQDGPFGPVSTPHGKGRRFSSSPASPCSGPPF